MIETYIDWTEERIIEEINTVFSDAPIMLEVARCEGVVNGKLSPDVVNPINGSNDIGPLQISQKYHGEEAKRRGLDLSGPKDSIAFGRILYDRNGLRDWEASRHCWDK